MATDKNFIVKNGFIVNSRNVIAANGVWISSASSYAGPQGNPGTNGIPGSDGAQGPQGGTGAIGAQGPQGDSGTPGSPGSTGFQGPQGNSGPTGFQGAQGSQGSAGSPGPAGFQGPQGGTGTVGSPGPAGFQGPQGGTGPSGFQGAAGGSITQVTSLGVNTPASATTGEIWATNNISAYYSDKRLKNILGNIENALDKLSKINGVYYEQNELAKQFGYDNVGKREIGVIAQEVQKVLPEVIKIAPFDSNKYGHSKSGQEYLTVLYSKIVPLLIQALKEQKDQIDYIKSKL